MTVWRMLPDRDPWARRSTLSRDMDRLMRGFFGSGRDSWTGPAGSTWTGVYPPLNLTEDDQGLFVRAELPGLEAEDLDISVEGDKLILRGERKIAAPEGVNFHRRERSAGTFRRIVNLPTRIDPAKVTAAMKNGLLTISLPKAEEAKPRQIQVKSN